MAEGPPVVAVVGAGMSGLAAARLLAGRPAVSGEDPERARAPRRRVVVLEADEVAGGKVRAGEVAGEAVELGPDQFLRRDPSAERLACELGLGDDLVAPSASAAAVYSAGRLRELPRGLLLGVPTDLEAVARTGIVSPEGLARARLDESLPGDPLTAVAVGLEPGDGSSSPTGHTRDGEGEADRATAERSAGELLRARLGDELVDRLVDPLLGGINAGGVDHLSLGIVAPKLAAALVGHHDVLGPLASALPAGGDGHAGATGAPPSPFFGLRGGLARLVAACVADLTAHGVELRTGSPVRAIRRAPTGGARAGFLLETANGLLEADGVVVAVPGFAAAGLLAGLSPTAASWLASVEYSSVAVATFAYAAGELELSRRWTGFLVPRVEASLMTAATFLSQKWQWMSSPRTRFVRVSAGRYGDERIAGASDDELAALLEAELRRLAGLEARPVEAAVTRWDHAFPQYRPGYRAGTARLQAALAALDGIEVCGAVLGGIGIPACIASGEEAARRLLAGPKA